MFVPGFVFADRKNETHFQDFFFNVHFCVCAHARNALGGQQGASDPPALELKVVVHCHMWMLGTELWF